MVNTDIPYSGVGGRISVPPYFFDLGTPNGLFEPGEILYIDFVVCLQSLYTFDLYPDAVATVIK